MKALRMLMIAALVVLILPAAGYADTVFSNLISTPCNCGLGVAGQNHIAQDLAQSFTPTADYTLTGAKVHLYAVPPNDSGTVNFALYSSIISPSTQLATLGSSAMLSSGDEGVYNSGRPSKTVQLSSGVQYWLVLTPGTPDTNVAWEWTSVFLPNLYRHPSYPSPQNGWVRDLSINSLQMEIDGNHATSGTGSVTPAAVPEPASLWLCLVAIGILGLGYAWRRSTFALLN